MKVSITKKVLLHEAKIVGSYKMLKNSLRVIV